MPADAAAALSNALAPLRDRFPHVRWLPPDSLHLTLLFLGATSRDRLAEISQALDQAATQQPSFVMRTGAGGGRVGHPGRGALGVAWLSLDRGAAETAHLATVLSEALQTGAAWPEKGHAAHLTVARRASRHLVDALRTAGQPDAVPPVEWASDRIVLLESHLGSGTPRYEPLHVATLTGPPLGRDL